MKLRFESFMLVAILVVVVLMFSFMIVFIVFPIGSGSPSYSYFSRTKIEIKAWIDIDGASGHELVPEVSINGNSFNKVVGDMQPLWLDNRFRYLIQAKENVNGYCFLFWQRESDGFIYPNSTLILKPGFMDERWWINYGICR